MKIYTSTGDAGETSLVRVQEFQRSKRPKMTY